MRISRGRGACLAVAALAWGAANGDTVTFSPAAFKGSFGNTSLAVISLQDIGNRVFFWTTRSGVVVNRVDLYSSDSSGVEILRIEGPKSGSSGASPKMGGQTDANQGPSPTTHTTVAVESPAVPTQISDPTGRHGFGKHRAKRFVGLSLDVQSSTTGGNLTFKAEEDRDWAQLNSITGVTLFFQATWDGGKSYSRPFLLLLSDEVNQYTSEAQRDRLASNDPFKGEDPPASGTANGGQIPDSTGGAPSASGGSDINGEPTVGGGSSNGTNSSKSNNGLSSGAVIGIAVACGVVGLLLAFALVWFLIRRRKQKQATLPVDSSFASGGRTDELMAEKENGADGDAAPHSPYSDDGSPSGAAAITTPGPSGSYPDHHHTPTDASAIATGAVPILPSPHPTHHQPDSAPRSFTPYSDLPGSASSPTNAAAVSPSVAGASLAQTDEGVPRVSVPSATPGRATPRALTTPYAHLVEDGMTEEEIRRLEDEERQLDAAIEQAGRR